MGNTKFIGITSGTGLSGVLKFIRKSNVNITVTCFPNLNQVNPQQTSFNGILTNFFETGYIIQYCQITDFSGPFTLQSFYPTLIFEITKTFQTQLRYSIIGRVCETYKVNINYIERHTVLRSRLFIIASVL